MPLAGSVQAPSQSRIVWLLVVETLPESRTIETAWETISSLTVTSSGVTLPQQDAVAIFTITHAIEKIIKADGNPAVSYLHK